MRGTAVTTENIVDENPKFFIRNSERSSFKTCPQQWQWAWEMGLVPAMPKQDARWFGSGLHVALAEWYQPEGAKNGFVRGRDPRETFEEYCGAIYTTVAAQPFFAEQGEQEYVEAKKLGAEMLGGYLEHYDGTDPTVEVIFPEYRYSTKVPFNNRQIKAWASHSPSWMAALAMDDKGVLAKYISTIVGTFDMVFRDQLDGFVKLMDHKSAKQKTSGAHLVKDDQAGTYIAVSTDFLRKRKILRPTESVVGMTYNYLRKGRRDADATFDEQGRKRNLPTKKDYAEALATRNVGVAAELEKLPKPKLEEIAAKMPADFKVYGAVSKVQPAPLFWREDVRRSKKNRIRQIERIADDAEMLARARAGEIPIMKSPGDHCAWCDFRDLCDVHEDNEDVEGFIKDVFVQRDPYADHQEGAVNSKTSAANDKSVKSNVRKVDFGGGFG